MNLRSSRVYSAPVPKMPPGLVELMEGLARDVLKNNPTDVYKFCAEHMQKLLQIRDGITTKNVPSLNEKIAFATKKVRDRAARRQDEFDKKIQLFQSVQGDSNIEAEQYIKQNIVKIPQNQLTSNVEHEIIAGLAKESFIPSEHVQDNNGQIVVASSDANTEAIHTPNSNYIKSVILNQEDETETIVEESVPKINSNNIDENDLKEENNIVDLDEVSGESENAKNNENLLKQQEIIVEEQSIGKNSDKVVLPVNEDIKNSSQHEDTIDSTLDTLKSNEYKQVEEPINVEKVNNNNEENKDYNNEYGNSDVQGSFEDANSKKDGKQFEPDLASLENTNTTFDAKNENVKASFDKDAKINGSVAFENNIDKSIEQIMEPMEKDKYSQLTGHVHNTSMDLETAAITIQKVFRSFLFRNKTLSVDDSTNIDINLLIEDKETKDDEPMPNINKDRRPLGVNRMDTVLQTVNEEKSLSLSTDDSSTLSSAATIIQAHVRGFLVRNNYNFNKTTSSTSGIDSDAQSLTSLEYDNNYHKNKTVLNIHIVPEGGHFMSRDESMLTSMDLSLDGSPPSSTNLHPLGYDKSERRKLKREDAIQSISPPSCNSGKLSEDLDSVKEVMVVGNSDKPKSEPEIASNDNVSNTKNISTDAFNDDNISTMVDNINTEETANVQEDTATNKLNQLKSMSQMSSDEMDVVTPRLTSEETISSEDAESKIKLMHSGECHDVVLPTKVSRSDTSVVRGE